MTIGKYINSVNKKTTDPDVNINLFHNLDEFGEETDLNNEITVERIDKTIRKLKDNKAFGLDKIANEYISLHLVYFHQFIISYSMQISFFRHWYLPDA